MAYEELHEKLEILFSETKLERFDFQNEYDREFLCSNLNMADYYVTLHNLQKLKPIYINDKLKTYYGFENNFFKDVDYFYYFLTIHPTSYGVLLDSLIHFKNGGKEYLNLQYKLKNTNNKFEKFIGSTKSIFLNEKPEYAVTLLKKVDSFRDLDKKESKNITAREREIIMLYCKGAVIKEIATQLNISESTVQVHLKNIYKKLGVRNSRELYSYFVNHF